MAVSGVKARLMLFEAAESNNNMGAERKPSKGEPPALQRFRQNQQLQEESRPPLAQKPGQFNLRQNSRPDGDSSESGGTGGRVNVGKMFQQGNPSTPLKPVIPVKKFGVASPDSERPKVALKPPAKAWQPASSTGVSKPASSPGGTKPASSQDSQSDTSVVANGIVKDFSSTGPVKLPSLVDKPSLKKTESSTSSASSSSSSSSKFSSSSTASASTSGPIDFRSQLRKTRNSFMGGEETAAGSTTTSSTSNSTKDLSPADSSTKLDPAKRPSSSDPPSQEIVERPSDSKRFRKTELSTLPSVTSAAPQKPDLPDGGIDLSLICQQHADMLCKMAGEDDLPPPPPPEDLEEDDIYDDGLSAVQVRQQSQKSPKSRDSGRVVSIIEEMTAEEEGLDDEIYDDGQTTQADLLYGDGTSDDKLEEQLPEEDDIYEDEETIAGQMNTESEEAKKKRLKEEAEAKKREEKRRKEEEKKKKQEEKEEQKRRKKFNLTGDETSVGEGTIKEDSKGRNMMTVKKGQIVTIVRLDNNPANKFLVKTDSDMGYVESSNIEIDPEIIRKVMLRSILSSSSQEGLEKSIAALMSKDRTCCMDKGKKDSIKRSDDDQPIYDDVAAENGSAAGKTNDESFEEEDIYQCVD